MKRGVLQCHSQQLLFPIRKCPCYNHIRNHKVIRNQESRLSLHRQRSSFRFNPTRRSTPGPCLIPMSQDPLCVPPSTNGSSIEKNKRSNLLSTTSPHSTYKLPKLTRDETPPWYQDAHPENPYTDPPNLRDSHFEHHY